MYNSFIFRKSSLEHKEQQSKSRKDKTWKINYKNNVRPALLEKYSRRINNFVLEEDKRQLAEFRQETQARASELLKQIQYKQKFLGDPTIRLRDMHDWNSILTTTDRIEKQKNKALFASKYGDEDIVFRSIASQSAYTPAGVINFRTRDKEKQIHAHNMRFSYRPRSFSQNRRQKKQKVLRTATAGQSENDIIKRTKTNTSGKDYELQRTKTNKTNNSSVEDELRSRAGSVFSMAGLEKDEVEESVSNHKEVIPLQVKDNNNNNKIYFKQVVDLEQNCKDLNIKKTLHQILVRFGITKIKDIKKQAMVETDNLSSDDF